MPQQTTFYEQQIGDRRIEILKSYDSAFAREAFDQMDEKALRFLGRFLELERKYDPADVPSPNDDGYADALWDEVQEGAREDWNTLSYFVVTEQVGGKTQALYVSADWPSAEAFTKGLVAQNHLASL